VNPDSPSPLQDHVEMLKGIYARWARDREVDPDVFDPEFEINTPMTRLESTTRRGYKGYRAWRAATEEVASDDWFEPEDFTELGDRVVVTGWFHFHGKTSGVETRDRAVQLWGFKQGKPSSLTFARTLEEALEAAGPRE
jgi:ketosteroid isomerase-like protein